MKYAFSLIAILVCLLAAPALGDDGHVPQATLDTLGLAQMETLSYEEGMQVRGMSGSAATIGMSVVTGLIIDPNTKSYIFGTGTNFAGACLETICPLSPPDPYHEQASGVDLGLEVFSGGEEFLGLLFGGAGGSAIALAR